MTRASAPPAALPSGVEPSDAALAGATEALYLEAGTRPFRAATLALSAAGFATFALLYCVQPLMPLLAADFNVTPAASSLSLSLSTGMLAPALVVASSLSEVWGRKRVMLVSLIVSTLLTLVASASTNWTVLLVARALTGLAISGVPAVAMAYVAEEIHPNALGRTMGLYIAGNAFGGMFGRVFTGILTDFLGWHVAVAIVGGLGVVAAFAFWRGLPPSRHFRPQPLRLGSLLRSLGSHLKDPGLRWLYLCGFLLMGGFVTIYNYATFRLLAPPFNLPTTAVSAIFAVYVAGIWSSAQSGRLTQSLGAAPAFLACTGVMLAGVVLTLPANTALVVLGVTAVTVGFFAAHSLASGLVPRRASHARAQASALYLFAYYLGSSVLGSAGGLFWARDGWAGVVGMVVPLLALALVAGLRLMRLTGGDRPAAAP